MKKLILITPLILIVFGLKAMAVVIPGCHVKTVDKTYFGVKLKTGLLKMEIIADDGSVVKVPINEVNSYTNGKSYFELLPTVDKNYKTNGYAMMELVKTYNELRLYRCLNYDAGTPFYDYYVFKKDCFHLLLDKKSAPTVLSLFGLETIVEL